MAARGKKYGGEGRNSLIDLYRIMRLDPKGFPICTPFYIS